MLARLKRNISNFHLDTTKKIKVFIYTSKILETQEAQTETAEDLLLAGGDIFIYLCSQSVQTIGFKRN